MNIPIFSSFTKNFVNRIVVQLIITDIRIFYMDTITRVINSNVRNIEIVASITNNMSTELCN